MSEKNIRKGDVLPLENTRKFFLPVVVHGDDTKRPTISRELGLDLGAKEFKSFCDWYTLIQIILDGDLQPLQLR